MLRRNPTRIELKLDDMSEYTDMQNEAKNAKESKNGVQGTVACTITVGGKTRQEIQDRLGYVPHPRPPA